MGATIPPNDKVLVDELDQFTLIDSPGFAGTSLNVLADYEAHCHGQRISTDNVIAASIRKHHPDLSLTLTPAAQCNLLAFAAAGKATLEEDKLLGLPSLTWRQYQAPPRKSTDGAVEARVSFARYRYKWHMNEYQTPEFLLYVAEGTHQDSRLALTMLYILADGRNGFYVDSLIKAASAWVLELHNEVWVYDSFWKKDKELYENVQHASWDDVILDESMKRALIVDVMGFFNQRYSYMNFGIPWKRGIIFHGPPGNGKTISIKALMHSLFTRKEGKISTLYVKALKYTFQVHNVFVKARAEAPCVLIFEDIDTLVTPDLRSYFFNEIDGLENNDGILVVASTNHLDRLDPGLSKRPSRFDRKYSFPDPTEAERTQYCEYWRKKLHRNQDILFPASLSPAIAGITNGFSFAYIKEAFVASLLYIVTNRSNPPSNFSSGQESLSKTMSTAVNSCTNCAKGVDQHSFGGGDDNDDLDKVLLWGVMKEQVAILREEMDSNTKSQPKCHADIITHLLDPDSNPTSHAANEVINSFLKAYPDISQHNPRAIGEYIEAHTGLKQAVNAVQQEGRELYNFTKRPGREHVVFENLERISWPSSGQDPASARDVETVPHV